MSTILANQSLQKKITINLEPGLHAEIIFLHGKRHPMTTGSEELHLW
jgi:hypothetical protein